MRIGYSAWGFTGDHKIKDDIEVSCPDGNSSYSWSILWEALQRGHEVFWMQENRDSEAVKFYGHKNFKSFSYEKRWYSYNNCYQTNGKELPELDLLLIEWRFPIPGRNCEIEKDDPNYQPDLDRQTEILEHYKNTTRVVWDLDHKLTLEDEVKWSPDAIFETSVNPLDLGNKRTRVEPPIVVSELMQFKTVPCIPTRKLVYVGSRYERDDVIDEWIKPVSEAYPFEVDFYGNWTRPKTLEECRERWPNILYNDRVTMRDFQVVYETAVACPLLGKKSYFERGFITPRPWEALLFGTIPVGLAGHLGIEEYTEYVASSPDHLIQIAEYLSTLNVKERDEIRRANVQKLEFMDVKYFIDKIEEVL